MKKQRHDEVQEAFEGYQEAKYKNWLKEHQKEEPQHKDNEQKAFEAYLNEVAPDRKCYWGSYNDKEFPTMEAFENWWKNVDKQLEPSKIKLEVDSINAQDLKVGDFLVLNLPQLYTNTNKKIIMVLNVSGKTHTIDCNPVIYWESGGGAGGASGETSIVAEFKTPIEKRDLDVWLKQGVYINNSDIIINGQPITYTLKQNDGLVLKVKINNSQDVYLVTGRITGKENPPYNRLKVTVLTYNKANTDGGSGGSANITLDATAHSVKAGQPATATAQKNGDNSFLVTFGIPKGEKGDKGERGPQGPAGPSGGGGGGSALPDIKAPKNDKALGEIKGKFGVNLFHYREMSQDNKFRVSGHTFMNNGFTKINENEKYIKSLKVYNRFKDATKYANKNVHVEAKILDVKEKKATEREDSHDFQALISFSNKSGTLQKHFVKIPKNGTSVKLEFDTTNNQYGYLNFQLGGKTEPAKGHMKIDAWYGDIKPKNQTQQFEFIRYNGFDIYANAKGTKNIYRHYKLYDAIQMNLNLVNLKDCKLIHVDKSTKEGKNMYFVQVPDDCVQSAGVPEASHLADNLMTNNLCDITSVDADSTVDHSDKPFFITSLTPKNTYIEGKGEVEVYCFQIIIGKEYAYKWRQHLTETQILYPTKEGYKYKDVSDEHNTIEKFIQLPTGGMLFTLNSGQTIETNKYSEIKAKERSLQFIKSPFGYPDLTINADNISSVTMNNFDKIK